MADKRRKKREDEAEATRPLPKAEENLGEEIARVAETGEPANIDDVNLPTDGDVRSGEAGTCSSAEGGQTSHVDAQLEHEAQDSDVADSGAESESGADRSQNEASAQASDVEEPTAEDYEQYLEFISVNGMGAKSKMAPDFNMVKNAMKNFGKNLIYVFVPMGIVYLFMLFAILLFVTSSAKNISSTMSQIVATVGDSIEQSSASVEEFLTYAFGRIDWNGNFFDTLAKIFDMNWISETVKGFFETLSASSENFDAQIGGIVSAFSDTLVADLSAAISLVAIGVWLSNVFTRYLLRRRTAKRTFKNFLVAHTLVPLAQSAVVFVAGILFAFIKWFAILALVAEIALWSVISLLNSYLIFRDKKVELSVKQIVTPRNVISHLLVGLLVLVIDVAFGVALWFLNPVLCVLIMIPVLIYSINIIDSTTDSYVLGVVNVLRKEQAQSAAAN